MKAQVLLKAVRQALREVEPGVITAQQARAERQFTRTMAAALRKVRAEIADWLVKKDASTTELFLLVRPDEDIHAIFGKVKSQFDDAYDILSTQAATMGRKQVVQEFNLGLRLDVVNEWARAELKDMAFKASQSTMDRMAGDVVGTLRDGLEDGLSIRDIRTNLGGVFEDMQTHELERIARTEIHTASQKGTEMAYQEAKVEYKQWFSASDDKVRGNDPGDEADHVRLNGEITLMERPFSNGLMYPGDKNGPIEEWINCRCRMSPFWVPAGMKVPPRTHFFEDDLVAA